MVVCVCVLSVCAMCTNKVCVCVCRELGKEKEVQGEKDRMDRKWDRGFSTP